MEIFHKPIFYGQNAVYNSALKANGKARCGAIYGREGAKEEVKETSSKLLNLIHPGYWHSRIDGNLDVETEKQSAYLILSVQRHTAVDLDTITMLDFYHTTNFIKEVAEAQKQK